MANHELPPNSDSSKRPKDVDKRIKERQAITRRPVAKDEVSGKRDDDMLKSFLGKFIVNDVKDAKEYVVNEVIEPRIRAGILDVIIEGSRFLLGGDGSRGSYGRSSVDDRRYGGKYTNAAINNNSSRSDSSNRGGNRSSSGSFDSRDYPVSSRGKAEEILARLRQDIADYDRATVAAFLKEVGVNPSYTDMDIGWYELDEGSCYVRGTLDGYVVVLPKPGRV